MDITPLIALGCTEKEARVYTTLLKQGFSTVSALCKALQEHRPTCYTLLATLTEKELVNKVKKGNRFYYEASDPHILETRLEALQHTIKHSMATFKHSYKKTAEIPVVHVHSTNSQIDAVFEDIAKTLPKNGTYFRYSARTQDVFKTKAYARAVVEKELERLVITSETKAGTKKKDSNRFIKTVPHTLLFEDNTAFIIYGNKIAHIDYTSDTGIIIESRALATFQEKLFKLLWKKL
jgi:sugar-specific transcriptional regulator TrmB